MIKLRIAAAKALLGDQGTFGVINVEQPYLLAAPAGIIALVPAIPVPDWGEVFSGNLPNLAHDDGISLAIEPIRESLAAGGGFGNWFEDPISGGPSISWVLTMTAAGSLACARASTILHLGSKLGWSKDDRLVLPRRGCFSPYPTTGLDRRSYDQVVAALRTLPLRERIPA